MAGYYGLENKEVIRIKVKKCDGLVQPEYKKFSIDPQITSFEMLQGILAKAFNIKSDFSTSYLAKASDGQKIYLSMLSDWDMDAACQCASEPYLKLKVDLKPFEEGLEDWDIITPGDIPQLKVTASMFEKNSFLGALTGSITSHVEKTLSQVQKVMGFKSYEDNAVKALKPAMTDMEFHNYLDVDGHLIRPQELRLSIYQGGIEPSLRKVVWRHLLNIFPDNMSGKERYDYLKRKEQEYYKVRKQWKAHLETDTASDEIKNIISVVKKDVLRTDRTYKFYAGSDDSNNILSLIHILVTYAVTHPDISYCQGMSDLASPLLVVQKDESHAYLCFCGLMKHMKINFHPSGQAMKIKLQHLSLLLQLYDPVFYTYLCESSPNHLFCFRWLLLELKREFPLDDALYMLEVMWSTLPPDPPAVELELTDPHYSPSLISSSPSSPTLNFPQSMYANFLALRLKDAAKARNVAHSNSYDSDKMTNAESNGRLNGVKKSSNCINIQINQHDVSPMEESYSGGDFPAMEDATAKMMQARSSSIDKSLCSSPPPQLLSGSDEDVFAFESSSCSSGKSKLSVGSINSCPKTDSEETRDNGSYEDTQFHLSLENVEKFQTTEPSSSFHSPDSEVPKTKTKVKHKPAQLSLTVSSKPMVTLTSPNCDKSHTDDADYVDATDSENVTPTSYGQQCPQFRSAVKTPSPGNLPPLPLSLPLTLPPPPLPLPSQMKKVHTNDSSLSTSSSSVASSQMVTPSESPASGDPSHLPTVPCSLQSSQHPDIPPLPLPPSNISTSSSSLSSPPYPPPADSASTHSSFDASSPTQLTVNGSTGVTTTTMSNPASSPTNITNTITTANTTTTPVNDNATLDRSQKLPPPQDFGAGNPFLMFLCLTILLQHRDLIINKKLECEEIDMYFQRLTRKQNVHKVLHQARTLYTEYLRNQQKLDEEFKSIEDSLSI
ncbi:Hypothetical predicted protein [Octopus vulgaris]|uniref:Rab-GAP TBC domain-containing protein n=1 Tax=Octopus vulgaris TaxID=6645 RepID=A0AA36BUF4_OCTVU|nr:Hypothetical predicted protein [Octopus vulgaris]